MPSVLDAQCLDVFQFKCIAFIDDNNVLDSIFHYFLGSEFSLIHAIYRQGMSMQAGIRNLPL
jgi:hypothetical protein